MFGRDWDILLGADIRALPLPISATLDYLNIKHIKYSLYDQLLDEETFSRYSGNDAFTYKREKDFVIFYNDKLSQSNLRIALLHEVGHIVMGHTEFPNDSFDGKFTTFNVLSEKEWDVVEDSAYNFALKLLSPASVLWALKIKTAHEIEELCDIPKKFAKKRNERMKELYQREKVFLATKGKTCFLQSPRERAVYENFREFIEEHKK